MKILILGGSGMLGHQLWLHFHATHETWVTVRRSADQFMRLGLFDKAHIVEGADANSFDSIAGAIRHIKPDVVLNCVGIVKQLKEAKSAVASISINSLLPHRLGAICAEIGARLILFSTDCVFSGRRGSYSEADNPDPIDLYGRSKLLGEVLSEAHVVTIRSSIIGRELGTAHSLIDWFLSQNGKKIKGFTRAMYTGVTTLEMARVVELILTKQPSLSGLWQVASEPISKYHLLTLAKDAFQLQIEIEPDPAFYCDRSLVGTRFNEQTGYRPPTWQEMIRELADSGLSSTRRAVGTV